MLNTGGLQLQRGQLGKISILIPSEFGLKKKKVEIFLLLKKCIIKEFRHKMVYYAFNCEI